MQLAGPVQLSDVGDNVCMKNIFFCQGHLATRQLVHQFLSLVGWKTRLLWNEQISKSSFCSKIVTSAK